MASDAGEGEAGIPLSFDDDLRNQIIEAKEKKKVLAVVGPRYIGKTLAIKRALKGLGYDERSIHIELTKIKDIEEQKGKIRNQIIRNQIKGGFNILEGTSYQVEYLTGFTAGAARKTWKNIRKIIRKSWEIIKPTQKLKGSSLKTPKDDSNPIEHMRFEIKLSEEDEEALLDHYANKYGINLEEGFVDGIILMSSWGKGKERILIPKLLERNLKKHSRMGFDKLNDSLNQEKSSEEFIDEFFAISLPTIADMLSGSLGSIAQIVAPPISLLGGAIPGLIMGISLLIAFREGDSNRALNRFLKLYNSWKNLPEEKRELFCDMLDEKNKLPPGTSYEFFSDLFKEEYEKNKPHPSIATGVNFFIPSDLFSKGKHGIKETLEKVLTKEEGDAVKKLLSENPDLRSTVEKHGERLDELEERI